jgi:hypothetical protein
VKEPDRDETRPIRCTACGRDFVTPPRWFGAQGPLCPACHDRMVREDQVRQHHKAAPDTGLMGRLKRLLGG